jgi:four helix bundle protein
LKFQIGRFLHLKSEIRNFKLDWTQSCTIAGAMGADTRKAEQIHQRLINLGARASRVAKMLPRSDEGRYISQQLLRSGLAAASNYAEARAAESRADFIHKLRIALKELNETKSWLEQIVANGLFSGDKMASIIAENQELCWILAASIKTARGSSSPI